VKKKALLVIDMQEAYLKPEHYEPSLIERINERIRMFSEQEQLIVYVLNTAKKNGEPFVSPLAAGLETAGEYRIVKTAVSAFSNESLERLLTEKEIQDVEVAGIDGNCCVAYTAEDAVRHGHKVSFPLSRIGIRTKARFEKTRERLIAAGVELVTDGMR